MPRLHVRGGTWRRPVRPQRRWRPVVIGALLVLLVVILTVGWRVRSVEVAGATIVPNAAVRDAVLAVLQQRRWAIFPRSSMVWAGINDVERELRQRFAFARVDGKRRLNGTVVVTVSEQPIAAVARFPSGGTLLIATSGQVLGVAPESLNQGALPIIQGAGPAPATGDVFLPGSTIEFLLSLWRELELAGGSLQPSTVNWREGSTGTVDIHTAGGVVISAATEDRPEYQLTKLKALLRDRPTPEARSALRSIDLRYGDRVYIQ